MVLPAFPLLALSCLLPAQDYDIVLANGRVMDPATGLDAVRQVGIRAGKIAAVSAAALEGRTVVDVSGLVVAPGFIDLHSHGQTQENYRFKARDGVTTALEWKWEFHPCRSGIARGKGSRSSISVRPPGTFRRAWP